MNLLIFWLLSLLTPSWHWTVRFLCSVKSIFLISSIHNLHSISPSSILFSAIVSLPILIVRLNLCPLLTLVCSYRREQRLTYLTGCLKILTFKRLAFYSISIYSWTKAILVYISSLPSFSSCAVVPSHTVIRLYPECVRINNWTQSQFNLAPPSVSVRQSFTVRCVE